MSPDKWNGGPISVCVVYEREREREKTLIGVNERLPPLGHRLRLCVNCRRVYKAKL